MHLRTPEPRGQRAKAEAGEIERDAGEGVGVGVDADELGRAESGCGEKEAAGAARRVEDLVRGQGAMGAGLGVGLSVWVRHGVGLRVGRSGMGMGGGQGVRGSRAACPPSWPSGERSRAPWQ